jgi:putative ABC transport system permease protein
MRYLPFVLKSALRNVRRFVLTVLSVAVSLFMFCTLMTVLTELERENPSEVAHLRLVVRRATSLADPLPESYGPKLAAVPGVRAVQPMNWFGGLYIDERNFFANFAVDVQTLSTLFPENVTTPTEREALQRDRMGAMVGRTLAEQFGWKRGDRVTLLGTIYPVDLEFTIRAIYTNELDDRAFFFHREYFEEALGRPGRVGTYWLLAQRPEQVPHIAETVDAMFRNTDAETKTETEQSFRLSFVAMLGNVKTLIVSICSMVVLTILLVTANTIAMTIRERAREVAILKTVGFRRRTILVMLVGEAAGMALAGGLLGSVGARVLYQTVDLSKLMQGFFRHFIVTPETIGMALLIAAAIGILSAGIPAWRAAGVPVAEALRRVG